MNRHEKSALLGALLTDPSARVNAELKTLGIDEAWERVIAGADGIPEGLTHRARSLDARTLFQRARSVGAQLLIPGDDAWPPSLNDLGYQAPWALWAKGNASLDRLSERSVAIVGARACTSYGQAVASQLAYDIAASATPVVSGGAFGIDAAAHRGALVADGCTIAVLSCGIDRSYPAEHTALFERICDGGLIISESAPGAHPTRPSFLVRNRLIAALSYGTVVVEARVRSGSISTFAHARHLNRVLMAVPGPVSSAESCGTNALLQDDARLVTNAADVLSLVLPLGEVEPPSRAEESSEWDQLPAHERHVYDLLPARAAVAVHQLQAQPPLYLDGMALLAALASLAQRELVTERDDGSWRRARSLRGARA